MDLDNLIIDDRQAGIFRVHRSSMTSAEILELERERIFERCWLYVGHESEVEKPGDYRRRIVAGRPLFMVRSSDREVRVFLNSCTHRGALICRSEEGNAEVFQCFYHAWSFNNRGELVGVPDEGGYAEGFDRGERNLRTPARVGSYRGFYFVSFNPAVEDLETYLAGAKEYLDLVADQSEVGMRVIRGANRYTIRANWKLLVENSLDGYHAVPVHQTFWDYQASLGVDTSKLARRWSRGRALGNGHAVIESESVYGRPVAYWSPLFGEEAREEIERIRARLVERFGEERAQRMCATTRNLLVYPNLIVNDIAALTVRQFWPIAPAQMDVTAWELAPREESAGLLARRLDSFLTFLGPGGFATPDDSEALESCQAGFMAREVEWSDISRGMHREPRSFDELQMRAFWRQWHAQVRGLAVAEWTGDGPPVEQGEPAALRGRS